MGNRGCLHNESGNIVRHHRGKRWIICLLNFKGRKREIMAPGRYTELFFWDEAVALAAGHRPCAECRYPDYQAFKAYWAAAHGVDETTLRADAIDWVLHRERLSSNKPHIKLDNLPNYVFVTLAGSDTPHMIRDNRLHPWHPQGYDEPISRPSGTQVMLLTPPSTVAVLQAGYQPTMRERPSH